MPTINKPKKNRKNENTMRRERMEIYNTSRWRELRRAKFITNPLCELCLQEGRVKPAEDIHHIVSFMSVYDRTQRLHLAFDYGNLMSLCKQCHQKIHNAEGRPVEGSNG